MNLLNFNTLKEKFVEIHFLNNQGEYMEYKNDLEKILNDFNSALLSDDKNKTQSEEEKLIQEREEAKLNLDINKIKEIDEILKTKNK